MNPLSPEKIAAALSRDLQVQWHVQVFDQIDSTHSEAARAFKKTSNLPRSVHGHVYFAESQTQGRGRDDHVWISPPGNLYGSLIYIFQREMIQLAGLSLVVGLAVQEVLTAAGLRGVQLKWPNDVWVNGKKIAGILIETVQISRDICCAIIGIGINVGMSTDQGVSIDQPWTSMTQENPENLVDRNLLAAQLLTGLSRQLVKFEQVGFQPFVKRWSAQDVCAQRPVILSLGDQKIQGIACGVNHQGALCLQVGDELRYFWAGEVSLRPQ